jgi:hypothetical protein
MDQDTATSMTHAAGAFVTPGFLFSYIIVGVYKFIHLWGLLDVQGYKLFCCIIEAFTDISV